MVRRKEGVKGVYGEGCYSPHTFNNKYTRFTSIDVVLMLLLLTVKHIEQCKILSGTEYFCVNLLKTYELALTLHVSDVSNGRSLSKLNIVKTIRTTKKQMILDALII